MRYFEDYKGFILLESASKVIKKTPKSIRAVVLNLEQHYGTLYVMPTIEIVEKPKKFYCIRYILPNGRRIRFNFANSKLTKIVEVDLFGKGRKGSSGTLDVSKVKKDYSEVIIKLLSGLKDGLNESFYQTIAGEEVGALIVAGALIATGAIALATPIIKEIKARLKKAKKEKSYDRDDDVARGVVKNKAKEVNSLDLDKEFTGESKTEPELLPAHRKLTAYIDMVIKGDSNSLIVCGEPGTGKTRTVLKRMWANNIKPGKEFVKLSGKNTPAGLYTTLYQYNDKIIVFDDCDSVFKDKDGINLLKAALDTYDVRTISYKSSKGIKAGARGQLIPGTFEFTGKCIFVTNLTFNDIDGALKSRALVNEMLLTEADKIALMKHIITKIKPNIPLKYKEEALNEIVKANKKNPKIKLNTRTLLKAIAIRASEYPEWQEMVYDQCINI